MRNSTTKEKSLINSKKSIKKDYSKETIISNQPKKKKQLPRPYLSGNPKNVLIISDLHLPFVREGYLEFVHSMQVKYKCGTVVCIGDEVDLAALSAYEKDPDGMSAGDEIQAAYEALKDWFYVFPKVSVCIGNHSCRMYRKAKEIGIPKGLIKTYNEIWNAPKGWVWADSFDIEGVHYTHGSGSSGPQSAIKRAVLNQVSTVMGHIHSEASVQYSVSKKHKLFGMIVGSAIDDEAYAFHYGKDMVRKSVISCGIVLEGRLPIIELMEL